MIYIERHLAVPIRTFELEAYKVGICLSNKDMDFVMATLTDPHKPHCVYYEEIIRQLVPQIQQDKSM